MESQALASAEHFRRLLSSGGCDGALFRRAICDVTQLDRDVWVDYVFGLGVLPDDGPDLPVGCVPYLPCPVDTLLRVVDGAGVGPSDVFVDIGSGLGRAAALISLLTGASVVGVEVQSALVRGARKLATRLRLQRATFIEGDATTMPVEIVDGSIFLLNCPFSGDRLSAFLSKLQPVVRTKQIRLCFVDLPLPPCSWLEVLQPPVDGLVIYRGH